MKKYLTLILLISLFYSSNAQENLPTCKASVDSLKKHLYYLASDKLEGRQTGTKGQREAAEYIDKHFKDWGLKPIEEDGKKTFYQSFSIIRFPIRCINETNIRLRIEGALKGIKFPSDDFIILSRNGFGNTTIIPYLGDSAKHPSNSNHAPVIFCNTIDQGLAIVGRRSKKQNSKYTFLVLPTNVLKEFSKDRFQVFASTIILPKHKKETELNTAFNGSYYFNTVLPFLKSHPDQNIILIDKPFYKKIFKSNISEKTSVSARITIGKQIEMTGFYLPDSAKRTSTENVVGIIEGTSKRDEAIIVCAHYDHLGIRAQNKTNANSKPDSIFNGADDNASGTSAVLEIARLLTLAKERGLQPKRTIIVAAFTAEEIGLIGSRHMVKNPIFPMNKIKMVVNLDMVGRTDKSHTDTSMYVYPLLVGSKDSTITHSFNQNAILANIGINSKMSDFDQSLCANGSDHASFVKKGIPAIMVTTGMHSDYHKPTDEANKINFPRLARITNFTFYTVWKLANQ